MAYPSVTNTFVNSTTASASQVNQNFSDIINGLSDGTKDLNINSSTLAGNLTVNGNTTLGNSSGDDVTITGSLAASIAIKTNNIYDIGAATLAPSSVYLGAPSSRSTRLRAHQSLGASNTLVFPNGNGNSSQKLSTDGSGNLYWSWQGNHVTKNDNYQVLDTDGYDFIDVTVVAKTITLPTAADNTNRMITVRKFVSGNGITTIKGEAAGETVDGVTGTTGINLDFYKEEVTLICTGTTWEVVNWRIPQNQYTLTATASNWTTTRSIGVIYKTNDSTPVWRLKYNINGSFSSGSGTNFNLSLTNITFYNGADQAGEVANREGASHTDNSYKSWASSNTSNLYCVNHASFTFSGVTWCFSGDVELNAKPSLVV